MIDIIKGGIACLTILQDFNWEVTKIQKQIQSRWTFHPSHHRNRMLDLFPELFECERG
jgi:hypothetical protein